MNYIQIAHIHTEGILLRATLCSKLSNAQPLLNTFVTFL